MNSKSNLSGSNNDIIDDQDINVSAVFDKYLYHWPVFLVGLTVAICLSFIYLRYTKPVYQVNTTLLIKDEKKGMPTSDLLSQLDMFGDSKVVENEVEILQSKTLMNKVVQRLNLNVQLKAEGNVVDLEIYGSKPANFITISPNPEVYDHEYTIIFTDRNHYQIEDETSGAIIKGNLNQIQRNKLGVYKIDATSNLPAYIGKKLKLTIKDAAALADEHLSNLSVMVAGKQSTVLNLSFQTTVPSKGKDILNTLIQVYNEVSLADKNQITQSTIKFLDERLGLITGELTNVEKDVEAFKSNNSLTDISGEASAYLENVKVNDAQLNQINIKLASIRDIQRFVNSNEKNEKLPSTFGIEDPVILNQVSKLSELLLQRDQLLTTTQESNPLVETVTKQIESTRSSINSGIANFSSSLQSTKRELERNDLRFQGSIQKIPGQERAFISIKRQQTIKESLYLFLLQKKEETALSYASTIADSRIVDEAYIVKNPIKPKRSLTYLLAIIIGMVFPVLYIYLKDILNNKVSKTSDVTSLTNTPLLGEILHNESGEAIVVTTSSRTAIAEQFRAIRTNMQFVHNNISEGGHVTLFTSSMSGEGKSFVASNLATAMAVSGKKTVLLEFDLRKPKISKYLNLTNSVGLSNYLIGMAEYDALIKASGISPNLSIIGSGPIPPNPSELILSDKLLELISALKRDFDEIIIDSPPIGLVTDAQILSRVADVTIYLIRQGVTFKNQVSQIQSIYSSNKFPKLNLIINGIKAGGAYGYGYGYGYYTDDIQANKFNLKSIFKDILKRF